MTLNVVAIIAAYNEEDIIGQVVRALIDDGVKVYFIDHQSTDGTLAAVQAFDGRGVIGIESFPPARPAARSGHRFTWEAILSRKEELAASIDADWFIHHDADEFRESPWPNETLADGIARADAAGYNAIDFEVLNFWPTSALDGDAGDVRQRLQLYEPAGAWDRVQIKCWKKTRHPISLAQSGGHSVEFVGRRVCPVRFLLRHYPIRSQAHGERKVFRERKAAFDPGERARGWHVQYDAFAEGSSFVRSETELRKFDPDAVRLQLLTRHRGVERLEQTLAASQRDADRLTDAIVELRAHLTAQDAQIEELRRARSADAADAEALGQHLRDQDAELARLRERTVQDVETARRLAESQAAAIERLRRERDRLHREVDALRAQLLAQDVETDRLRREAADHQRERARISREVAAKDTTIEHILASRSWRITAPLRAADRWMRGRASESSGRGLAIADLPLGGGLRLAGDVRGFWADGWAGRELEFQFRAVRAVTVIRIAGRVPHQLHEGQDFSIEVGDQRSSHHVSPGSFELRLPVAPGAARIRITASRSWQPSRDGESQDDRELAWLVTAIAAR